MSLINVFASVTDNTPLQYLVCVCHIQSVSVTGNMCLWLTVSVCHIQYVSVTDSMCLLQTICVCHTQSVFFHRQSSSVTDICCLSQKKIVWHRRCVSVPDSLFCHRQSVFVTDSLYLSQKVFVCQSVSLSNTLLDNFWPNVYLYFSIWGVGFAQKALKGFRSPSEHLIRNGVHKQYVFENISLRWLFTKSF